MSNLITVAELAEELGVSKQLIYYHSNKISKDFQIKNQSNQLVFSPSQADMMRGFISKKKPKTLKKDLKVEENLNKRDSNEFKRDLKENFPFKSQDIEDISKYLLEEKEDQIKMLKGVLKKKDERIDSLLEQLSYSQKLLDQQQQLEQYRNRLYLIQNSDIDAKESNGASNNKKWWEFWL